MPTLRSISALIVITALSAILAPGIQAQSRSLASSSAVQSAASRTPAVQIAYDNLPDAPGQLTPVQQQNGSISGAVTDQNGAEVVGARVTLETSTSKSPRVLTTDGSGLFNFTNLPPGAFTLTITSEGFATSASTSILLQPGQSYEMAPIAMLVASATTDVEVNFSQHDIAEEQIKLQEKQRVIGIFPNFYVTYNWNAVPLTAKQKFKLAFRTAIDPIAFASSGVAAGIEQWQNEYSGYGQGAQGYAKRFGASYADGFSGNILGGAVLPSLLHQDPRYFYKGTGSIRSRALYAIASVVICKGDNGRWQPNYSNVLGNLAAAGISNVYYPSSNRNGAELTIRNALIGSASGAIGGLFQEFLIKKISRGIPPNSPKD